MAALTRKRLAFCSKNHTACLQEGTPLLPTCVLEIQLEDGQDVLRLHKSTAQERANYTTLSYCWGRLQDFTTFMSNLHAIIRSIPENSLPQFIRDAIRVTRTLHIRYL
jgi:hypothetical protein